MDIEELKPCPFCGSGVLHKNNPEKMGRTFFVSCGFCDCRGACLPTEQGAVDAWNTRAIPDGYVVVPVSKLGALELENKMLEAANEAAGKIESLLRQRLQDVRMYLLAEADKHTPRDPILGEAYQMTQRHLEWCPAAAKGQS